VTAFEQFVAVAVGVVALVMLAVIVLVYVIARVLRKPDSSHPYDVWFDQ